MSEECTHNCETCSASCDSREKKSFLEAPHALSSIGKVIGIVSGKGGVGKSLVTALLAAGIAKKGKKTAVLDADVTGPSIPKMFGLKEKAAGTASELFPVASKKGTDIMSVNLLLDDDSDPVVWRGPVIAGVVKQFWQDVVWKDVDYMFVDMPPGTGDVPLTVFQSIPLDGIIVVTSPQELVSMVVGKAVRMANMMNIPILGVVENMSYVKCPDCGKEIDVFGKSGLEGFAKAEGMKILGRMPIDSRLAKACDEGAVEDVEDEWLGAAREAILAL